MKKTSRLLLVLGALSMLAGCTKPTPKPTPEPEPEPVVENLINVIYFNSYVSDTRAEEMKTEFIAKLQEDGTEVDESKVNFFKSRNTKVAGLVEEILDYNDENPSNTVDVLLGANGFSSVDDEEVLARFEAKYENDGQDYTYGTHTNVANNKNRKFWYDKDKLEDTYVKGLQDYLKEHWVDGGEEPPVEETGKLTVAVYGVYVSEARTTELENGFKAYLTAEQKTIDSLVFVRDDTNTTIATFIDPFVKEYNEAHADAKVDVLLGLKSNAAITAAGYSNNGKSYNYDDVEGKADGERKFWFDANSANQAEIQLLEAYLDANWTKSEEPPVEEDTYFLTGDMNTWATDNAAYKFTKSSDGTNHYYLDNIDISATQELRVYWTQGADDSARYLTNSTEGEGYTLNRDNGNIVVTEDGNYKIDLYPGSEYGNPIVLTKNGGGEETPKNIFTVAIYSKYVSDERAKEIEDAFKAYLEEKEVALDGVVFTSTGTGNVGACAKAISDYNTEHASAKVNALLGANGDSSNALANAGYKRYSETNYLYGDKDTEANQKNRKIWVEKDNDGTDAFLALVDYMNANWTEKPVVENTYFLTGDMNTWATDNEAYKFAAVVGEENHYVLDNVELTANQELRVYWTQGADDDARYLTNSTEGEGYTLNRDNGNVVVSADGTYKIDLYPNSEYGNPIVLTKHEEEPPVVEENTYFLTGSFNTWATDDASYKFAAVEGEEGHYVLDDVVLGVGQELRVYWTQGADDNVRYLTNSTEGTGYTINSENGNVVVSETGTYKIDLYPNSEYGNPIVLTKHSEQQETVTYDHLVVAVYSRYLPTDKLEAFEVAFKAYLKEKNIEITTLTFTTFGDNKTTVSGFAGLLVASGTSFDALLGANGDSEGKEIAAAGYVRKSEQSYSYGSDAKRKLWVAKDSTNGALEALEAFLDANYKVVA